MFGWTGSILELDLTKESSTIIPTAPEAMEFFVGGKGLGAYYLWKNLAARVDPLSPDNVIIIATGPLQGTRIMPNGRHCVVTKSPLTGLFIDTYSGGHFGPELKFAGLDAVIIRGAAAQPTWVSITDDHVVFHDAGKTGLWGLNTGETEEKIRDQLNDAKTRVISIGPAGENGAKIACLMNDGFHAAGRGGTGAVFGAKNLKAISVRGTQSVEVANPDKEKEIAKDFRNRAAAGKEIVPPFFSIGTSAFVSYASGVDQLPTRNYQAGEFTKADDINGTALVQRWKIKKEPCYGCTIGCVHVITDFAASHVHVPEYENLAMLGSNCGVDNLEAIISANDLCNQLGLDTISTGNVIGFFMECSKRGYLNGVSKKGSLDFGDSEGLLNLIQEIAAKKDIGTLLADGVREAARKIGHDSADFAIHVKGLEMAAWDPRGYGGLGISYAVAAAGASHLRGWPSPRQLPSAPASDLMPSLVRSQDEKIWKDNLIICDFNAYLSPTFSISDLAPTMAAITGRAMNEEQISAIAQRTWILARLFNMREWDDSPANHDVLPPRLMKEPLPSGTAEGCKAFVDDNDFRASLQEYYKLRKCDSDGRPFAEEVEKLGLNKI